MNKSLFFIFVSFILIVTSPLKAQKHPRLFFSTDDIKELSNARYTTHKEEWKSLRKDSEHLLKNVSFEHPEKKKLHSQSEKLAGMALMQLLDSKLAYLPYLKKSMLQFCRSEVWQPWFEDKSKCPVNDLGMGQYLVNMSATYDMLYPELSKKERVYIEKQLIEIADKFCDDYPRFRTTEFKGMNCNHGTNVYSGLTAVRYVVDGLSEGMKAKWDKVLSDKFHRLTTEMNHHMSDGVSDEGATYYMFQLKTYLLWFEILRHAKYNGTNKPFEDLEWFKNTSKYAIYSILPGGTDNFGGLALYGDAKPEFWGNPTCVFPLLAKTLNDPIAQWMANDLDVYKGENKSKAYYDVWRYLWKCDTPSVNLDTLKQWHLFEDVGIFAWRSSWKNDAAYFTCKSGQHYQGHAHPDDGQFMIHKNGIPYIVDMGYSHPKLTTEHNVLIIDGKGQKGDGEVWPDFGEFPYNRDAWGKTSFLLATDKRIDSFSDYFDIVLDPTSLYDNKVLNKWQREFIYLDDFYVLHDKIDASRKVEMELLMHSLVSVPGKKDSYDYSKTRKLNPFSEVAKGQWNVKPSTLECELFKIYDLSSNKWSQEVKESWFYDNYKRRKGGDGHAQLGYHISSKINAKEANSTFVMGFESSMKGLEFENTPSGLVIFREKKKVGQIVWDKDDKMNGYYHGLDKSYYFFRSCRKVSMDHLQVTASNPFSGVIVLKDKKWHMQLCADGENHVQINKRIDVTSLKDVEVTLNGETTSLHIKNKGMFVF